jgi:hypothetical protein
VDAIMRELASNKVVFGSHALNSGPWLDDAAALPARFKAALVFRSRRPARAGSTSGPADNNSLLFSSRKAGGEIK